MADANTAIVRRLVDEVINRGNVRLLPDLVAEDHVGHHPTGELYGPEGVRIAIAEYCAAFPDFTVTIDDLVAEGDRVAHRFTARGTHRGWFMAVPATGRSVTLTGIGIDRLAAGKLVESWIAIDTLGVLRQLGVVLTPAPFPAGAGGQLARETPTVADKHELDGKLRRERPQVRESCRMSSSSGPPRRPAAQRTDHE